jgi:hypothetical protein
MRITEILIETREDIRLLILLSGFDLSRIESKSFKVKEIFLKDPSNPQFNRAMKTYLFQLNLMLLEIINLPQWEKWSEINDGNLVKQEISKLYNDNLTFMKKY